MAPSFGTQTMSPPVPPLHVTYWLPVQTATGNSRPFVSLNGAWRFGASGRSRQSWVAGAHAAVTPTTQLPVHTAPVPTPGQPAPLVQVFATGSNLSPMSGAARRAPAP